MTHKEFLAELGTLIGGKVDREEMIVGGAPRLYTDYHGYFVKVDFITGGELMLDVNTPPPQRLRIRREGFVSKTLGRLGIVCDRKVGDMDFDEKHLIDNASQEWAAQVLSGDVRRLLTALEPFALFELTNKEYRCLKAVDISDYTPSRAAEDVDAMVRIVELIRDVGT
jgi:hypothetical protein